VRFSAAHCTANSNKKKDQSFKAVYKGGTLTGNNECSNIPASKRKKAKTKAQVKKTFKKHPVRLKRSCTLHPLRETRRDTGSETKCREHVPRHIELTAVLRDKNKE
jgi:hypothetical protein